MFAARKRLLSIVMILMGVSQIFLGAQDVTQVRDTLPAAIKQEHRFQAIPGEKTVLRSEVRRMVSAAGEADFIRYVQTLPGVASAAEGSSTYYVRGGDLGGNRFTVDGVTIYGASHLLGLASVFPTELVDNARFCRGGFSVEDSDATASHLRLVSLTPDDGEIKTAFQASNFIVGGLVNVPVVKGKVSFTGGLRVSPLPLEYSAIRNICGASADSLGKLKAAVYDVFGKLCWKFSTQDELSLSGFHSCDSYYYRQSVNSSVSMLWSNSYVNLQYQGRRDGGWSLNGQFYANEFHNRQGMEARLSESENSLAIRSSIQELVQQFTVTRQCNELLSVSFGERVKYARYNPGTSNKYSGNAVIFPTDYPLVDHASNHLIYSVYFQPELKKDRRYDFRATGQLNMYKRLNGSCQKVPEADLLCRINIVPWLYLESTADWRCQFHHVLEGIPIGWSVDLVVPSDEKFLPEYSTQYYLGLGIETESVKCSVGAYKKNISNLLFFRDSKSLFSSSLAGWENNIDIGVGTSWGVESMLECMAGPVDFRLSYTYSKTDRTFPNVNKGMSFPAKFDRRNILNCSSRYAMVDTRERSMGFTALVTWQSGHFETVPKGVFEETLLSGTGQTNIYIYSSVNNYRMPDYVRCDVGYYVDWAKNGHEHSLNVGVYNILNRHNPFMVFYDSEDRSWKQLSLIPIMPSISYRIEF